MYLLSLGAGHEGLGLGPLGDATPREVVAQLDARLGAVGTDLSGLRLAAVLAVGGVGEGGGAGAQVGEQLRRASERSEETREGVIMTLDAVLSVYRNPKSARPCRLTSGRDLLEESLQPGQTKRALAPESGETTLLALGFASSFFLTTAGRELLALRELDFALSFPWAAAAPAPPTPLLSFTKFIPHAFIIAPSTTCCVPFSDCHVRWNTKHSFMWSLRRLGGVWWPQYTQKTDCVAAAFSSKRRRRLTLWTKGGGGEIGFADLLAEGGIGNFCAVGACSCASLVTENEALLRSEVKVLSSCSYMCEFSRTCKGWR